MLRRAAPYEWGWTSYYLPSYVRGLLYLQMNDGPNARAQFQGILDHQGVMPVSPLYSLASLQIARAAAVSKDTAGCHAGIRSLLRGLEGRRCDHPLLTRARAEHQQLARSSRD